MKTKIIKSSDGEFAICIKTWWWPWWRSYEEPIGPECYSIKTFTSYEDAKEFEERIKQNKLYTTWSDVDE